MSNLALEQALATMGTDFYRADVGDRRVLQALVKNDWPLGGETSGHIVLRWLHSTGDGIIAALQVLAIMCETGKPLSELLANFHPLPQCSRNVKVADKRKALENNVVQQALSEVETRLRGHGRIVVRPSGTEEFVRIMVEAENKTFAQAAADEIYAALTAV